MPDKTDHNASLNVMPGENCFSRYGRIVWTPHGMRLSNKARARLEPSRMHVNRYIRAKLRHWKRFAAASILILMCNSLFAPHNLFSSASTSDTVLKSMGSRYPQIHNESFQWTHDACVEYFRSIAALDGDWSIENFNNERQWFGSKNDVKESVRHLRIYGHCFITNAASVHDLDLQDLERKLFPLFTGKMADFNRWDGFSSKAFPLYDESNELISGTNPETNTTHSFWRHSMHQFSGKGIVVSVADHSLDQVKSLLRSLRIIGNRLPIQFVHKGDLSDFSKARMVEAGREPFEVELNGELNVVSNPQEIWFVNAKECLTAESVDLFRRFANKWIACLFSSFKEMILMDTDVVPFVDLQSLFDAGEYRTTGAYFFRDRPVAEFIKESDVILFENLLPTEDEHTIFQIPRASNLTLQNPLFTSRVKHVMESGMVIIDRSSHLPGLLLSTHLQLWHQTNAIFYGDKELFWLGQSIAGNEQYSFNNLSAGAIGTLEGDYRSDKERVCSSQIAHFSSDLRLLWVNSGLKRCKLQSWEYDYNKNRAIRSSFDSIEKVKEYYESEVRIDAAIILPGIVEANKLRRKGHDKVAFKQNKNKGCNGYVWCAVKNIHNSYGTTVIFDQKQLSLINLIVRTWNYG